MICTAAAASEDEQKSYVCLQGMREERDECSGWVRRKESSEDVNGCFHRSGKTNRKLMLTLKSRSESEPGVQIRSLQLKIGNKPIQRLLNILVNSTETHSPGCLQPIYQPVPEDEVLKNSSAVIFCTAF